jgi:hypothetical protein
MGQPQGLNSGYKATLVVVWLIVITSVLWGLSATLNRARWLGALHTAYRSSSADIQRKIPVYMMHIVLDTVILATWVEPVFASWCGCTDAASHALLLGFNLMYIVVAYGVELVWRQQLDLLLTLHHVVTICIIMVCFGELAAELYLVADTVIILGVFAVIEQPTYVALLLMRVLPEGFVHTVRAWKVAVPFWFVSKTLSLALAVMVMVRDWPLMPTWAKAMYTCVWALVYIIQVWSGFIQLSIMRKVCKKAMDRQSLAHGLLLDLPDAVHKSPSADVCVDVSDKRSWPKDPAN